MTPSTEAQHTRKDISLHKCFDVNAKMISKLTMFSKIIGEEFHMLLTLSTSMKKRQQVIVVVSWPLGLILLSRPTTTTKLSPGMSESSSVTSAVPVAGTTGVRGTTLVARVVLLGPADRSPPLFPSWESPCRACSKFC